MPVSTNLHQRGTVPSTNNVPVSAVSMQGEQTQRRIGLGRLL